MEDYKKTPYRDQEYNARNNDATVERELRGEKPRGKWEQFKDKVGDMFDGDDTDRDSWTDKLKDKVDDFREDWNDDNNDGDFTDRVKDTWDDTRRSWKENSESPDFNDRVKETYDDMKKSWKNNDPVWEAGAAARPETATADYADDAINKPYDRQPITNRLKENAHSMGDRIKENTNKAFDNFRDKASEWSDKAEDYSRRTDNKLRDNVSEWDEKLTDSSRRFDDKLRDNAADWDDKLNDASHRFDENMKNKVKDWTGNIRDRNDRPEEHVNDWNTHNGSDTAEERFKEVYDNWDDKSNRTGTDLRNFNNKMTERAKERLRDLHDTAGGAPDRFDQNKY